MWYTRKLWINYSIRLNLNSVISFYKISCIKHRPLNLTSAFTLKFLCKNMTTWNCRDVLFPNVVCQLSNHGKQNKTQNFKLGWTYSLRCILFTRQKKLCFKYIHFKTFLSIFFSLSFTANKLIFIVVVFVVRIFTLRKFCRTLEEVSGKAF